MQSIYKFPVEYEEFPRKTFKTLNGYNFRVGSQKVTQFLACGKEIQNLRLASPCIIIHSNESTSCSNFSDLLLVFTAQHISGILMPIIRSSTTAVAASGLPLERGGSSAVGRDRAGRPDHDQQHCYHHVPTVNQRLLLQLL